MNTFDLPVFIGFTIAVFSGFSSGLLRSAVTVLAYLVAMPIAVWVMSYIPPLDEGSASPLPHNAGFFLGAFFAIGMALGKLGRMMVDEAIGDDPGIGDRLGGATLGARSASAWSRPCWCWYSTASSRPVANQRSSRARSSGGCSRKPAKEVSARCRPEAVAAIDRPR